MAAPTFVGAGAGVIITTGGAAVTTAGVVTAVGDLVILQVMQDGTAGASPAFSAIVDIADLAGTANALTSDGIIHALAGPPAAYQRIRYGRVTGSSPSVTVTTDGTDYYCRIYVFRGVATGTTLSAIAENQGATSIANVLQSVGGAVAAIADVGVTTTGADRLAVQIVAVDDDNPLGPFTGMTGGTWAEAVAEFASATGTDGAIQLQTATMASAGTINGGSFTMAAADNWNVVGFALIPPVGGPATLERQAALAAVGLIAAIGREQLARLAALNATAAVASSGIYWTTMERTAALAATGQVAAAGVRLAPPFTRAAALAAAGAISSSGISVVSAAAALAATAGIATVGRETLARAAAVTASAQIASAGREQLARLAELACAAQISVAGEVESGTVTHSRSAALAGSAGIATVGRELLPRAAVVTVQASITTAPQRVAKRSTAVGATAAVTAAGDILGATQRSAAVAATGAVSASGTVMHVRAGAAALTATGALTSVPQRALGRAASVTGTPTLAAQPQRALARTAGLDTLAAITTTTGNVGQASFTAIGTITLSRFLPPGYLTSTRAGRIAVIYQGQIPVTGLGGIEYPGPAEGELALATVGGIARTGG